VGVLTQPTDPAPGRRWGGQFRGKWRRLPRPHLTRCSHSQCSLQHGKDQPALLLRGPRFMADPIATTISVVALAVSSVTAYLTFFRRGTVKMTQPTVIFFGPDSSRIPEASPPPKVFIRTLLFSTSKRGRIIESMHVSVARNESKQNFNIWVHGDDKLVRGSGLFVGETGLSANHHFLAPKDGGEFRFADGTYTLEVHAKLLGDEAARCLWSQSLIISRENAAALQEPGTGLYFDWGPDAGRYIPHVEKRPPTPDVDDLLKVIGIDGRASKGTHAKV
jgi:hypothetical protein